MLFQVSGLKFQVAKLCDLNRKVRKVFSQSSQEKNKTLRTLRNPLRALRLNFKPETKIYILPIRITSAKIPDAVTAAPAPAPFINNG